MRGLTNKVAIVTGGLGDLGYAAGQRLAEEGCRVYLFDILDDPDNRAHAIGCTHLKVDISQPEEVAAACAQVKAEAGHVGILVNNAARFIFKSVDASPQDWQDITSVNLNGTTLMAQHVTPHMKELGGGSIVNLSSISGFVGQANFATYNATKFAIRGLTKCWAQDLAPHGIRVNSLCPGYIYTTAFINSCKDLGLDIEEEDRRASELHLLGRQGKPEEVASCIAFLASNDSSFMTGSDMLVDGGYLAK